MGVRYLLGIMQYLMCGMWYVTLYLVCVCVCVCSDGLKSRHLWRWDKAIFTSLCSYGDEEDEGQGTDILTPTILSTTLTHFMT